MVLLLAGYAMSFSDAKAWALRNWPDMDVSDEEQLPLIIAHYHRLRGQKFICIPVELKAYDEDLVVFFPLDSEEDPRSTAYKYKQLPETEGGLRFREWLFTENRWDRELAEKTRWTTVADPYYDWRREERMRAREAAYAAAQAEVTVLDAHASRGRRMAGSHLSFVASSN